MGHKHDIVAIVRKYNSGLDAGPVALKYEAMRKDAFSFFRGTCHLFYDRLPACEPLTHAPAAWCCGDLHLENFGSFKGDNRLVYFDLNDFDEALLAPCVWDLIRVVASITMARGTLGVTAREAARLSRLLVDSYAGTLAHGKAYWLERDSAGGAIGAALARLKGRSRKELLERRTVVKHGKRRIKIDGTHALAAPSADQAFVRKLFRQLRRPPHPRTFTIVDIARRIAGTGSLGLARWAVLVAGKGGGIEHMRLIDVKRARRSSSVRHVDVRQPEFASEAARVVAVQTRCQAVSPAFLTPLEADGHSYVVRELQPHEDRFDLAQLASDPDGCDASFRMMGSLLAWAQLRASGRQGAAVADDLIAFGHKSKWRRRVLEVAAQGAERARKDWETYAAAYDAGHIRP